MSLIDLKNPVKPAELKGRPRESVKLRKEAIDALRAMGLAGDAVDAYVNDLIVNLNRDAAEVRERQLDQGRIGGLIERWLGAFDMVMKREGPDEGGRHYWERTTRTETPNDRGGMDVQINTETGGHHPIHAMAVVSAYDRGLMVHERLRRELREAREAGPAVPWAD